MTDCGWVRGARWVGSGCRLAAPRRPPYSLPMKPLHEFNAKEADRWIIEMRQSLAGHADKLPLERVPGDIRAAMDTHLMLLREMATIHPGKRAKIEALIERYQR